MLWQRERVANVTLRGNHGWTTLSNGPLPFYLVIAPLKCDVRFEAKRFDGPG